MQSSSRILNGLSKFQLMISAGLRSTGHHQLLKRCNVASGESHCSRSLMTSTKLSQGLSEPTGPEVPLYDALNVQLKGYDFAVLEKFAKYVHHTADRVGLEVEDSWATPATNFKVTQLKPESNVVETEYLLNLYERNVQIVEVPATLLPVFVNIVEASIPAGITMRIHPHLPEHSEVRYVPDLQLKELKKELQDLREKK